MKCQPLDLKLIWLPVLTALVLSLHGCNTAQVPTATPTLEAKSTPTYTPIPIASPTLEQVAATATIPPETGEWNSYAENLGRFTFEVSADRAHVKLISVDFEEFTCQDRGISGKWLPEDYTGNIVGGKFTVGGLLAGYMELSFSGMQPGVNPFPEVTFSGEFDKTGTRANGTWNVDWDGVSCSGIWSPWDAEPTPVSQAPPHEPYYIYPFCTCKEDIPADRVPTLRWAWVTTSETYTSDFINASKTTVTIDDMTYNDLESFWGKVAYSADDDGYKSLWVYELPSLSPGEHRVEISISLDRTVTDGYDSDGDNQEDQFGPGEVFYGWVDIHIEATPGSSSTACPNGAPAGHWALIVVKGSSGDGTITIDDKIVSIKSGENTIYLSTDKVHSIKIGTNTLNYTAPECGENSVSVP